MSIRARTRLSFAAALILLLNFSLRADAPQAAVPNDIEAALEKTLTESRPWRVTFFQAIEGLRDQTGANIFVNWTRLAQAGIPRTAPIELVLHDVTLESVLDTIVKNFGDKDVAVAWRIWDGNIIAISTADDLGPENVITRVYPIEDLLRMTAAIPAPSTTAAATSPADRQADRAGDFAQIVLAAVAPGQWHEPVFGEDNPWEHCNATVWARRLIVSTTRKNHQKVANFLRQMRGQK